MVVFEHAFSGVSNTFFYAVLGNRRLTDEILITLCLVEQSLNTRPLVPASSDATDLDDLTLIHFLLGTAGSVRLRWEPQAPWLKEYVPSLNKRSKWPNQPERQLNTGDLVWIIEPSSPRGHYPLARVTKLNFGSDAIARSAELNTNTGRFVRPVVKLSPPFVSHPESEPF